jgi:hypothetical protein
MTHVPATPRPTRAPGQKRTKAQRLADRSRIAELRLRAWTLSAIAQEVGISLKTCKRELAILHTQWREDASEDIAAIKARELHKLDQLESEAGVSPSDAR